MAECPGIVHLAAMADGGLARVRAPGGSLSAAQLRAVADAAERLGSGVVDLTSRANLQIRGLAPDGGVDLAATLEAAGFRFHGEADRRRNILLDPFAGLDRQERRDMRPLGAALDAALIAAPWIGLLSVKFSFALDGAGASRIRAVASDVTALAVADGIAIFAAGRPVGTVGDAADAVDAMLGLGKAAAEIGPKARAQDLWAGGILVETFGRDEEAAPPASLAPRYGAVPTVDPDAVALSLAVPVGRIDPRMLAFLADVAESDGDGSVRLAPWSGIVLPRIRRDRAPPILAAAEAIGFTPVPVAERLTVVACAGAPSCEKAREPAKALGAAILARAAAEPGRLPKTRASLHLSACPKGCAGSAPADLLLLGASERDGWGLHRAASPRRPGAETGRLDGLDPDEILDLLARRG